MFYVVSKLFTSNKKKLLKLRWTLNLIDRTKSTHATKIRTGWLKQYHCCPSTLPCPGWQQPPWPSLRSPRLQGTSWRQPAKNQIIL